MWQRALVTHVLREVTPEASALESTVCGLGFRVWGL